MAGTRAFDDGRWPDQDGLADCFLCGRPVDPRDGNRGSYSASLPPPEPGMRRMNRVAELPIHIPCLNGREMVSVEILYRKTLLEASDANHKQMRQ